MSHDVGHGQIGGAGGGRRDAGAGCVEGDAELIVSEIVTNAIKATNIIPPQARYPELYDRMEVVCLCFYRLASELVIEVWDPKQEPPRRRDVSLDDEGGRGLFLVEALCKRWGVRWPPTGGKCVWVSLAIRAA